MDLSNLPVGGYTVGQVRKAIVNVVALVTTMLVSIGVPQPYATWAAIVVIIAAVVIHFTVPNDKVEQIEREVLSVFPVDTPEPPSDGNADVALPVVDSPPAPTVTVAMPVEGGGGGGGVLDALNDPRYGSAAAG